MPVIRPSNPVTGDQSNPFAGYSPEDQQSIREQLVQLQSSGSLNPEQRRAVLTALQRSNPQAGRSSLSMVTGIPMGDPGNFTREYAGRIGQGLANIVRSVGGLADPNLTPTERRITAATGSPMPLVPYRIGRGVYETGVAPFFRFPSTPGSIYGALRDLYQSGKGNVPGQGWSPAIPGGAIGLEVPGLAGEAAGAYLMGKAAREGPGYARSKIRIGLQETTGAGKEPVLEAARQVGKQNMAALQQHAEDTKALLDKHTDAVTKQQQKYQDALADYREKTEAGEKADTEKLRTAKQDWVNAQREQRQAQADINAVRSERQSVIRGMRRYDQLAMDNLQQTFQTVRDRLNSRWYRLRKSMESWETKENLEAMREGREPGGVNSEHLQQVIDLAKDKYLVGAPESLRVFNNLTGWMRGEGEAGIIDTAEGGEPRLRPMSWSETLTHHSAIGDYLAAGDLPGNVIQALRYVREKGTGAELERVSGLAKQDQVYGVLNRDYAQYMTDWIDRKAVTRGGSPLNPATQAADLGTFHRQVTGPAGDRLMETLAKYKNAGANPRLLVAIRQLSEKSKAMLKKGARPGAPAIPMELRDIPKFEPPPPSKVPPMPEQPQAIPPPPPIPRPIPRGVNPYDIRLREMEKFAARPMASWSDLFPPRFILHLLSKYPALREWVAQQRRQETPPF